MILLSHFDHLNPEMDIRPPTPAYVTLLVSCQLLLPVLYKELLFGGD